MKACVVVMPSSLPVRRNVRPIRSQRSLAEGLAALAAEARASRFPSQPKMGTEWWARFYALADANALEAA